LTKKRRWVHLRETKTTGFRKKEWRKKKGGGGRGYRGKGEKRILSPMVGRKIVNFYLSEVVRRGQSRRGGKRGKKDGVLLGVFI